MVICIACRAIPTCFQFVVQKIRSILLSCKSLVLIYVIILKILLIFGFGIFPLLLLLLFSFYLFVELINLLSCLQTMITITTHLKQNLEKEDDDEDLVEVTATFVGFQQVSAICLPMKNGKG